MWGFFTSNFKKRTHNFKKRTFVLMTVTELRKSIFKVFDEVEKTGVSREVTRKGKKFLIQPLGEKKLGLDNWKPKKKIIIGDPTDLVDFKVWDIEKDWREPDILDGKD